MNLFRFAPLFLLTACAPGNDRNAPEHAYDTPVAMALQSLAKDTTPSHFSYAMDWFYLRGSKSSSLEDSAGTAAWQADLLERIRRGGLDENSDHRGGGPNGAEWNPEAGDLFIIATVPFRLEAPTFSIKLGNEPYDAGTIGWENRTEGNGALIWFTVPAATKNKRMQPVKPFHYEFIYGERLKDSASFVAPLDVGEVLVIRLKVKNANEKLEHPLSSFFHAAYGE